MADTDSSPIVTDVPDQHRYEVRLDGELAGFAVYHRRGGRIYLVHTEVDPAFEGKGIGSALGQGRARRRARARGAGRAAVPVHARLHRPPPRVRRPRRQGDARQHRRRLTTVAHHPARVAELADAGGLNPSDLRIVWVRIPPRAPDLAGTSSLSATWSEVLRRRSVHRSCTEPVRSRRGAGSVCRKDSGWAYPRRRRLRPGHGPAPPAAQARLPHTQGGRGGARRILSLDRPWLGRRPVDDDHVEEYLADWLAGQARLRPTTLHSYEMAVERITRQLGRYHSRR